MKFGKILLKSFVVLFIGIFTMSQVSYAALYIDDLRQESPVDDKGDSRATNATFDRPDSEEASHLEPRFKFVDIALSLPGDQETQANLIEKLIAIGPAYQVREGKVFKNPVVVTYLESLGLATSEKEALRHEATELTLEQAERDGILTTDMLVKKLNRICLGNLVSLDGFKDRYNENWGHERTFDDNPRFALRHILAERFDGGHLPKNLHNSVWVEGLYFFAKDKILEAGIQFKELTPDDVIVFRDDSPEVTQAMERIGQVDKAIRAGQELAEEQARMAIELAQLRRQGVFSEELQETVLSGLRQQSYNLGRIIEREDEDFYNNITSSDIGQEQAREIAVVIPADVVLKNL